MDRAQKEKVVEELGQIFESSGVVVVAHYAGLTVAEMQVLRARMGEAGGAVRVAKNKLAKIALEGKPCESISGLLTGMTVLAYSEDPRRGCEGGSGLHQREPQAGGSGRCNGQFGAEPRMVSRLWLPCPRAKSLSLRSCRALVPLHPTSPVRSVRLLPILPASFRRSKSAKRHKQPMARVARARPRWTNKPEQNGTEQWLTLKALAEQIVNLTLLEAQELKTILKDEYGIEPAAGGAVMMAGPAGDAGPAAEEKTEFDVVLVEAGANKIAVIKRSSRHHRSGPERSQGPGRSWWQGRERRRSERGSRRNQEEA